MRRPVGAVVAVVCLVVGLAGCSGKDEKPSPTPTTLATSAPTATPTGPTEPVLPDAAKADTAQGAAKFVEYYIALMNYAANTGDVGPMRAMASKCDGCEKYASLYEGIYAAGGYFRTSGWVPTSSRTNQFGSNVGVLLSVSAPAVSYRLKSGAEVKRSEAHKYKLLMTAARGGSAWQLVGLANGDQT